ncbi:MAG: mannose-1-phosphate guanylyltransferase [Legionellales bacterium RIFCSPHIGHO2_12_FULL_42_9]|nr:MAG: mannose-1-phosphate guanylyltransferase [Legionellales bacterium RIFCSPHIGHO2_12_FULL_42_9]
MRTALILAAGRGKRLRPLTDTLPKPLCRVQGVTLIEYHLIHLSQAGFTRIIINHAHLGDQIRQYLGNGSQWDVSILYSPEPPGALETGGGIYTALQRFGINDPFITVNADILTDYPFAELKIPTASLAHLILVPNPKHNNQGDFGLDKQGALSNTNKQYTVAGIIGYRPKLFSHCEPGRYSVIPLIKKGIEKKQITGEVFKGQWQDIGSIERLDEANRLYCARSQS